MIYRIIVYVEYNLSTHILPGNIKICDGVNSDLGIEQYCRQTSLVGRTIRCR